MQDAELEAAFNILLPGGMSVEDLPLPQRAAYGALMLIPMVEESEAWRRRHMRSLGMEKAHGPSFKSRERSKGKSYDRVSEVVKVGASTLTRVVRLYKEAPDVFDRMKRGGYDTVEDACRDAGIITASEAQRGRQRPRSRLRDAFKNHLQPLHVYLKGWTAEGSFNGMTPSEARRLLPQVRETHYALLEVERALEERATVSRALK